MGRRGADQTLHSRVHTLRTGQHLSQQELARRAGITRQAVNAIEAARYVPNTSVALRLARALGCRVEDLFQMDDVPAERRVQTVAAARDRGTRVVLADMGNRLIAHPLAADRALSEGFASADAVLLGSSKRTTARLLVPPHQLQRTALILGCDPGLRVLADHLSRRSPDTRLVWLAASSRQGLDAIARREAHVAGSHLSDPAGGYNLAQAKQALGSRGGLVITFASWEQGFVIAGGNPKALREAADLARPDVQVVNREAGAGARQLLDNLLREHRVPPESVHGYDREVTGHLAVARAVAAGSADVGVALRAAAELYGMGFIPLTQVRFDLVIPRSVVEHPAVSMMVDVLQSRALREEMATFPGYEVTGTGALVADFPAAA